MRTLPYTLFFGKLIYMDKIWRCSASNLLAAVSQVNRHRRTVELYIRVMGTCIEGHKEQETLLGAVPRAEVGQELMDASSFVISNIMET
jgi:hypothetical protein